MLPPAARLPAPQHRRPAFTGRARVAVFSVDGVSVPAVSLRNLIESKRTGRLQDLADIQLLEELQRLTDHG